jgi:hypothetical protein
MNKCVSKCVKQSCSMNVRQVEGFVFVGYTNTFELREYHYNGFVPNIWNKLRNKYIINDGFFSIGYNDHLNRKFSHLTFDAKFNIKMAIQKSLKNNHDYIVFDFDKQTQNSHGEQKIFYTDENIHTIAKIIHHEGYISNIFLPNDNSRKIIVNLQ